MKRISLVLIIAAMISLMPSALAIPVDAELMDVMERQDPLQDLPGWHELGPGFPIDEEITADSQPWEYIPCPNDYQGGVNFMVTIQNLSPNYWTDLHYVADPETSFSNDDGLAQDISAPGWTLAFRIDNVGMNTPLIWESQTQDNIFEPGEIWEFVVQDYSNSQGLPPSTLGSWDGVSKGMISYASLNTSSSSASIIAIPEPGVVALMSIFALGFFIRRLLML